MLKKLIQKVRGRAAAGTIDLDLAHYDISEPLHFGSQRVVSRAVHRQTGAVLALKHVSPRLAAEPERLQASIESLKRERTAGLELIHRNVVRIYGLEEWQGAHYLVMEYLPDGSLWKVIRHRDAYTFGQQLDMCIQIASGLAYLHRNGVVHRDLKPGNILFSGERVVITDFGLCDGAHVSGIRKVAPRSGTPKYMSPEQTRGWELTPTSDVYSMGIILYEVFAGELTISAEQAYQRRARTLTCHFAPPNTANPRIPEPLNELVMRCLHNSRKIRYTGGTQLLQALETLRGCHYKYAD